jgi:ribonucleoside-triphosphate reductase
MVTINLPRIVYESEKDKNKFVEILKERYELATRTLDIKARTLKQREKTVLPFLTQNANGDEYFRFENCTNLVNFAGFQEAKEFLREPNKTQQGNVESTSEIMQTILNLKAKAGRRHGRRFFPVTLPNPEASERLAKLDIEKYGIAKVKFSGTREKPFYSTTKRLQLQTGSSLGITPESLVRVQELNKLNSGGNLSIIELGQAEYKPDELMNLTAQLCEQQTVEFFTYNRISTYCSNCSKSWIGTLSKCPSCGAMSTLTIFDRFSNS